VRSGGITVTDKLFTGLQDEPGDSALGLYNYKARFYSTTFGRFVSADPVALFRPEPLHVRGRKPAEVCRSDWSYGRDRLRN